MGMHEDETKMKKESHVESGGVSCARLGEGDVTIAGVGLSLVRFEAGEPETARR